VRSDGLSGVVARVRQEGKPFGGDPRSGPWASVIKRDAAFAAAYAAPGCSHYICICEAMRDALFDRDTAPALRRRPDARRNSGADRAGHDVAHATSAARYLEECLPRAQYWDVAVEAQTEDATNRRITEFWVRSACSGGRPMSIIIRRCCAR